MGSTENLGVFAGRVIANNDPLSIGRVRVRVPIRHGIEGTLDDFIADKDLPWALPASMPAGGSPDSGGISWLPEVGDQIWVEFLDGQLTKPVWSWGNQNINQIKTFGKLPLHAYQSTGLPVKRAALTRFKHWIELLPDKIQVWTKNRYMVEVNDGSGKSDGFVNCQTANGYFVKINDGDKTIVLSAPNIEYVCNTLTGTSSKGMTVTTPKATLNFGSIQLGGEYQAFEINATSNTSRGMKMSFNSLGLSVAGPFVISAPEFFITSSPISFGGSNYSVGPEDAGIGVSGETVRLGRRATDSLVRLSDLKAALTVLKKYIDTHTHSNVSNGNGVSGPPSVKLKINATASDRVVAESVTKVTEAIK